jgi:hypothetical protein
LGRNIGRMIVWEEKKRKGKEEERWERNERE